MNSICIDFPEIIDVRCTKTHRVWTVNQQHPIAVPDGVYEISFEGRVLDLGGISNPVWLSGGDTLVVDHIKHKL